MISKQNQRWYERDNEHGFWLLGLNPSGTQISAYQDAVVLRFYDDDGHAGIEIPLTHASFKDFLAYVVHAREAIEAKQQEEE
jgi:hypothetical protein